MPVSEVSSLTLMRDVLVTIQEEHPNQQRGGLESNPFWFQLELWSFDAFWVCKKYHTVKSLNPAPLWEHTIIVNYVRLCRFSAVLVSVPNFPAIHYVVIESQLITRGSSRYCNPSNSCEYFNPKVAEWFTEKKDIDIQSVMPQDLMSGQSCITRLSKTVNNDPEMGQRKRG